MQSGSIWKFKNIRVKFPTTPYIDQIYKFWCGNVYHVENYYVSGKKYEWTTKGDMFPHISKYGYGVLEEVSVNMLQLAAWMDFYGDEVDSADRMVRDWNNSSK